MACDVSPVAMFTHGKVDVANVVQSAKGFKLCVLSVCDAAIRKEFHINSTTKEKLDHFQIGKKN